MPNALRTGSPGRSRRRRKKSSLSLLATPKAKQVSNPKLHETIDLVDDDDDVTSEPTPVEISRVTDSQASTENCPDLIVIDEVGASDTSCCATPKKLAEEPVPSTSSAVSAPTSAKESNEEIVEVEVDSEDQDIEIVGIKIAAPTARKANPLRLSNSSSKKLTPLNSRKNRRSSCSITFANVQQVIKRARLRMSNSPMPINRIAPSSRTISKKKKSKKKKSQQQQLNAQSNRAGTSGISSRFLRSRRFPVPVFNTLRELGPANPNFRQRCPDFFPVSSDHFGNFPSDDGLNPFMRRQGPPLFNIQTSNVPAGPNNINVNPNLNQFEPGTKRPIVIDGSNVAMAHGNNRKFSCRGIKICAQFFLDRGHTDVTAFVPQFRTKSSESIDPQILEELYKQGIVKFTPSREVEGRRIASYDDRFIVQCAVVNHGIIISNDNYRDLYKDEPEWRETIQKRILQFTWVNEEWLMFPQDPLGKKGPLLDEFLLF